MATNKGHLHNPQPNFSQIYPPSNYHPRRYKYNCSFKRMGVYDHPACQCSPYTCVSLRLCCMACKCVRWVQSQHAGGE